MDAAELDAFIDQAKALTCSRNAEASARFGLGSHARYDLDLAERTLAFRDDKGAIFVTARIVPIGSLAPAAGTWLWSWENDSIPKNASADMNAVRRFGETRDIAALQRTFSPCDEALAWALSAIALKLLDGEAIYRIEQNANSLFLLLFDVSARKTVEFPEN